MADQDPTATMIRESDLCEAREINNSNHNSKDSSSGVYLLFQGFS